MLKKYKGKISILGEYISPPRLIERYKSELYIISFPKTGRTWLRMMMKTALHKHLNVEMIDPLEFKELVFHNVRMPYISVVHDDEPHWKTPSTLTKDKTKWYRNKKVVLLIRDPRDTMVSLYFQMTRRWKVFSESSVNLKNFIWQDIGGLKTMIEYYNIWADNKLIPSDLLMIKYEDLHTNTLETLKKVIYFLGFIDMPNSILQFAVEENRIEKLRKLEINRKFTTTRLRPGVENDCESLKMRKGEVGGYVNYLDSGIIKKIDYYIYDNLDVWYEYQKHINLEKYEF